MQKNLHVQGKRGVEKGKRTKGVCKGVYRWLDMKSKPGKWRTKNMTWGLGN